MKIKKSKTVSPAARIQIANERTGTALFVFEQAAVELEFAAAEFAAIEDDLNAQAAQKRVEARALDAQSDAAFERSVEVSEQAAKIRGLIGSTSN